jgi:hypothetical protein
LPAMLTERQRAIADRSDSPSRHRAIAVIRHRAFESPQRSVAKSTRGGTARGVECSRCSMAVGWAPMREWAGGAYGRTPLQFIARRTRPRSCSGEQPSLLPFVSSTTLRSSVRRSSSRRTGVFGEAAAGGLCETDLVHLQRQESAARSPRQRGHSLEAADGPGPRAFARIGALGQRVQSAHFGGPSLPTRSRVTAASPHPLQSTCLPT